MLNVPNVETKRLLDLADFIENLDEEKFSMRQWGEISEPRCICGWFNHIEGWPHKSDWWHAADRLGLDEHTANRLFTPNDWDTQQAARALRSIAVSGTF